jgi:hypothetical protein
MKTCLYRPVGTKELALIAASGFKAFPPRLPDQPIFYPVTNEEYAVQIARDWNCKFNEEKKGYVTRFFLHEAYLSQFDRKIVGGKTHEELWVPAEQLAEFNGNILGDIEVIRGFSATADGVVEVPVKEFAEGSAGA